MRDRWSVAAPQVALRNLRSSLPRSKRQVFSPMHNVIKSASATSAQFAGAARLMDQRPPQRKCSGLWRGRSGQRKFGRRRRMDAANAVELATAPCIRVAFFAPMRRGLRHRLRCLTTLASLVWIYHCLARIRNQRYAVRQWGLGASRREPWETRISALSIQLKARTQKRRQIFYLNRL